MALGIAAIEDDGRVARDARGPQGDLEFLWGAAIPVARIFEAVRVEVERPGDVVLLVLFEDAEVDVKEEESSSGRRLGASAVEQLAEPFGVDELVIVRQTVNRKRRLRRPLRPAALVRPHAGAAQFGQSRLERPGIFGPIAVEDDLVAGKDALGSEQPLDLGRINTLEPCAGEGNRTGDMAAARRASRPPAVVGGQRPNVDELEVGVTEALSKFGEKKVRVGNTAGPSGAGHRYIVGGKGLSVLSVFWSVTFCRNYLLL